MKLHYLLLLAGAALLSTIEASLATTSTLSSSAAARSLSAAQHDIVSKRLLRAETTADKDEDEEERGFSFPANAADKVTKLTKSSAESARIQAKLDRVFKGIQLDTKNGFLFGSPALRTWAQNALKIHGKNSEAASAAMLATLTKFYKPADVARWIESAKVSSSVGNLATKLQKAQFTKWLDAGQDAIGVQKLLRNAATGNRLDVQRDRAIVLAFQMFAKQQ